MKQQIYLHIGQAGVQIGDQYWELLKQQHNLSNCGLLQSEKYNIESLFYECTENKFVPRCLIFDLDTLTVDQIRNGENRFLFHKDSLISGKEDAADNFARGCYTVGRDMQQKCLDRIRRLVEGCDSFEGFVFFNSICGGTGSGFASKLYDNLKLNYEKKFRTGFTIYPSPKLFNSVMEPYNALLAIGDFLEYSTAQFYFDNEALYSICENYLDIEAPNYANINQIIAMIQAYYTSSMRFQAKNILSLNDIITNLIPFPKIKAYTWWYNSEGMEEGQFRDASESIESLLNDYEQIEIN